MHSLLSPRQNSVDVNPRAINVKKIIDLLLSLRDGLGVDREPMTKTDFPIVFIIRRTSS